VSLFATNPISHFPGSKHSLVEWAPSVELMPSISARDFCVRERERVCVCM